MSRRFEFINAPQRSPEWFEIRKGGITATGITAINGTSPYKTAYRLWVELTGQVEEQQAGAAAQRGQLLEQAVADFYTLETGKKLRKSNGIVRLKEHPWAMASLDRTVVGEPDLLVEIKTSTSSAWSLAPVPQMYLDQVQWQMFVTNAPWCDIAVLLGGLVFRIERVTPDPIYQAQLYAKAVDFRNALATGVPPTLQGEDSDALAQVVPQTSEEWAQADISLDRLAQLYAEKQYESKLLDQELQNLAIGLKESIGEKVGIVGEGWSATWKQNKATVKTDWEKVAETLHAVAPDTYAEAVKRLTEEKAGARVFRFKTEEGL